MHFSFLIIDYNESTVRETLELFENFPNYFCYGIVKDNQTAVKQIVKLKPQLIFIRIPIKSNDYSFSLSRISELFQYIESIPYFIAIASSPDYAFEAIQAGFSDYIITPLELHQLGKSLFKFECRVSISY